LNGLSTEGLRESEETIEKFIVLSDVLKETIDAVLVSKIRSTCPEYLPPNIVSIQLIMVHAKYHIIEHYVDDYNPEGEDVRPCVLLGACLRFWASPHLIPTKAALELLARWEEYCILQVGDLNTFDNEIGIGHLSVVKNNIIRFNLCTMIRSLAISVVLCCGGCSFSSPWIRASG
jgi:hypothetical protein